jgi:hypothetical protein
MNDYAARLRCPAHNGITQDIREAFKKSNKPLSVYMLTMMCGRKPQQIKHALGQMMQSGGVVSVPGPKCILYSAYEAPVVKPDTGRGLQKAGIITIGRGSRWGAGRA